jgi:leucyl-tRNA synthetase
MDPNNDKELVNPEIEKYWGQVDSYVGGAEHAVLHLLYARFWHKFLYDIKVVSHDEPFQRLRNQGMILAYSYQNEKWKLIANDLVVEKDGKYFDKETWEELKRVVAKMSKSLKNVVNPDDIVDQYGADALRLYEMYMSDFKDTAPWNTDNIIWVVRFLEKVERAINYENYKKGKDDKQIMKLLHKTIKKVWDDIENYKFNTAIASLMILVNNWLPNDEKFQKEWKSIFVRLLHPFAPFLAEELWEKLWNKKSIFFSTWPEYDKNMLEDDTIKIAVQVLWKVRWTIEISKDEDKASVLEKAKNEENVNKYLEWKTIKKEIYVPGKIINFVI